MAIALTDAQLALIDRIIARGHYENAVSVVDEALRRLAEREQRFDELREKLQAGLDQLDRGESHVFTATWSEERLERARQRLAAGDTPNPDVCPSDSGPIIGECRQGLRRHFAPQSCDVG